MPHVCFFYQTKKISKISTPLILKCAIIFIFSLTKMKMSCCYYFPDSSLESDVKSVPSSCRSPSPPCHTGQCASYLCLFIQERGENVAWPSTRAPKHTATTETTAHIQYIHPSLQISWQYSRCCRMHNSSISECCKWWIWSEWKAPE